MSLSIYNIKKWTNMMLGKSIMHVNQDIGKSFTSGTISGYYNNLTDKVTMLPELLDTESLPTFCLPEGRNILFPVGIFQYGLGAYDLYLQSQDKRYKKKFMQCCQWAIDNQEPSGAWDNFSFEYPQNPYGAMAQGEAASLLIRGFKETGDKKYINAAKKAIDFMLLPLDRGGTSLYTNNGGIMMCEFTHLPIVLNGWIFAWFGLYDYTIATKDCGAYKAATEQSERTIAQTLPMFTYSHWSRYDIKDKIASPFYHRLHIAQMQAMHKLTGNTIYAEFEKRWKKDYDNMLWKSVAFIRKAWQKISEKE